MDDVVFGFVHDFGADEEWTAVHGGGAFLNGRPLTGSQGPDRVPLDRSDASRTRARPAREAGAAHRPGPGDGCQAITFCHLAAGRTDAVVCLKPSRSVDYAAPSS